MDGQFSHIFETLETLCVACRARVLAVLEAGGIPRSGMGTSGVWIVCRGEERPWNMLIDGVTCQRSGEPVESRFNHGLANRDSGHTIIVCESWGGRSLSLW